MSEKVEEKGTWKRYTEWVGSGFKASFTRDNILSINTALGTFLITLLTTGTLFITAFAMDIDNTLLSVGVISIWGSFVGFASVLIKTLFGGAKKTDDSALVEKIKAALANPNDQAALTAIGTEMASVTEKALDNKEKLVDEPLVEKLIVKVTDSEGEVIDLSPDVTVEESIIELPEEIME